MSRNRIVLVTIGVMLSLFLASMESTVVATAMPTIVSDLGGLQHYAWVFSAYMLASTATTPLYGKLSDLYGRRRLFLIGMAFFLAGSIMCGRSDTMTELILARGVQGLGAGGILPLVFILVGEMFTLKQRSRMQGLFSGVWGVSSIVGPLLGGYIVDYLSWQWVFYVNVIPGLIAAGLVGFGWREQLQRHGRPVVDYAGAVLLSTSIVALLVGLVQTGTSISWILIAASVILFILLIWVENRSVDPILPIPLFRERLFATSIAHGVLTGWAMFGSISFIPLFVQSVLGTTATQAGITMSPMLLGWVGSSIVSTFFLLKIGYRRLAISGTSVLMLGAFLMSRISVDTTRLMLMLFVALMGIGMGMSIPAFLIAVQTTVERRQLGTATSTMQFSRSIGGTLGVSVMGAALSASLISTLSASGLDPELVTQLLEPSTGVEAVVNEGLRFALANAISLVFLIAFIAAGLALLVTFLTPRIELKERPPETEVVSVTAE